METMLMLILGIMLISIVVVLIAFGFFATMTYKISKKVLKDMGENKNGKNLF